MITCGSVYFYTTTVGISGEAYTATLEHIDKLVVMSSTFYAVMTIRDCADVDFVNLNYIRGDGPDDEGQLGLFNCNASISAEVSIETAAPRPYGLVISSSVVRGLPAGVPGVSGTSTAAVDIRDNSRVACVTSESSGTNSGIGIRLGFGCSLVSQGGAPYDPAVTTVEANNIKVGDNAATTFATIATGLAAVVNDYATASPQMAFAVFSP